MMLVTPDWAILGHCRLASIFRNVTLLGPFTGEHFPKP